jgi:hypothetical protein
MESVDYFAAEKHLPIPTKDLLSWTFDDPRYDQDEAVSPEVSYAKTMLCP